MKLRLTIFLAGILTAFGIVTATADTLADIKARGTLVVGVQATAPSFSFLDPKTKELSGYEIDLAKAFAESLGVKADLKVVSSEARIPSLQQGQVDLLVALITYSKERAQQLSFSNAYLNEAFRILVRRDAGIGSLADLETARIGNVKGSLLEKVVAQRFPKATNVSFEDQTATFLSLQQDRLQAMAGRETNLRTLQIKAGPDGAPTDLLEEPLLRQSTGVVARKDDAALIAAVNAFLDQWEASGAAAAAFDKWLGAGSDLKLTRQFKVGQPIDQ